MQAHTTRHSHRPTLAGYREVNSFRGQLFYLPENLHRAVNLEEYPVPPVFQSRTVRPHRIHIARVEADRQRRPRPRRHKSRKTISIIFGKLAGPKESTKRFFKSVIRTKAVESPSEPLAQTPVVSPPPPQSPSVIESPRPRLKRPFSWAPGSTELSRMRVSLLVRRESKRRSATAVMDPTLRHSIASPIGGVLAPPIAMNEETRHSSPTMQSFPNVGQKIPDEKPVASGNGVSVSIALAEPCLFLQGFEQGDFQANRSTAMLRGGLHLRFSKATKIKSVTLKFKGVATTKWPEGKVSCYRESFLANSSRYPP
jgi:hypothetical protein